jgi:predicted ATP-grasp superfamily ATP-dependent carboligase
MDHLAAFEVEDGNDREGLHESEVGLRVFAWEYVTAGGWRERPELEPLRPEGAMMLRALARDLARIPGVEVIVAHDAAHPLDVPGRAVAVEPRDPWAAWRRIAESADAVWPIAPESDGVLEAAAALVADAGRVFLGCRRDALAIARSKRATAEHLARYGVPVIATSTLEAVPQAAAGWVVKPDDGAGASDTWLFEDRSALEAWRAAGDRGNFVVQPFVPGSPLSLSILAQEGAAWLLSCNRQRVGCEEGAFAYRGGFVGGAEARRGRLEPLAHAVAAALPGLWGHVGIDLIDGPDGPVVLEVNPRLTTSYAGLGESIGSNPAALVLALLDRKLDALRRPLAHRPIEIAVPAA